MTSCLMFSLISLSTLLLRAMDNQTKQQNAALGNFIMSTFSGNQQHNNKVDFKQKIQFPDSPLSLNIANYSNRLIIHIEKKTPQKRYYLPLRETEFYDIIENVDKITEIIKEGRHKILEKYGCIDIDELKEGDDSHTIILEKSEKSKELERKRKQHQQEIKGEKKKKKKKVAAPVLAEEFDDDFDPE